ncbi:MAG: TraB/GumN family protein [Bacteroidota bacterium]
MDKIFYTGMNLSKLCVPFYLIIGLTLLVGACKSSKELTVQANPQSDYNHLLWEVTGEGLKAPSYLYGTIHIIPASEFNVSDTIVNRFAQTERLVMEMDMDMMDMGMGGNSDMDFGEIMSMLSEIMLKPPQSLQSLLGEEDYAYLEGFMRDSLPTPIPFFQMFKPMFLNEQISISLCMEGIPNSYELYFREKAQEKDIPIYGLESLEDQMGFVEAIPLEEQAKSLMETVRNSGGICQEYQHMYDLYNSQQLDSLMFMVDEDPSIKSQAATLLDNRNQNWIPKIEAWMKFQPIFVAVGAAHLPGPQGVVELLREEGYTVRPVEF